MRFSMRVAVYMALKRDQRVLLLRRAGTGWEDGSYTLPAGHVEGGETATAAMAREAAEEIGVTVDEALLMLVHTMHRRGEDSVEYIDLFFTAPADSWEGEPYIAEPGKCDDLGWFALDALPERTLGYVAQALGSMGENNYSAAGWN